MAEEEEKHELCDHCHSIITGDDINNMTQVDDGLVCQTCYENEYFTCEHCDNLYPNDEGATVQGRHEEYWCESCLDNHAISCDSCGDYFTTDYINTDDNGTSYCESCADDRIICESCRCWTSEWNGDNLCDSCAEDSCSIHDYSYKPSPRFHPQGAELYLGVELETDKYPERQDAAEALNQLSQDEHLFYLKEDSSLDNGIEIVTHPCSLEYHQDKFPWKDIIETSRRHDGLSHNSGDCGIHVHFNKNFFGQSGSREEELSILKLMYMFEKYWDNLVKFSRRSQDQIDAWALKYYDHVFPNEPFDPTDTNNGIEKVKRAKRWAGHGYAVNLCPDDTIEIRIFRGSLRYTTLMACIELTAFLACTAKKRSANVLYRMNWKQLVKCIKQTTYPNLIQYLKERELCA